MNQHFQYGKKEIEHLKKADKRLAEAIEKVGVIKRGVNPDLFSALVNSIVGQQISTKAQQTIWARMTQSLGEVSPDTVDALSLEELQKFGITFKKAEYIKSLATKVLSGEFDIHALNEMTDEEVCAELSKLKGIGVWTAEMLMIFSMQRPDILSYGDLAIHRGMRMLYRHRSIDKTKFEKYRERYTPYASVASLYLWAIAGGVIAEMKDIADTNKNRKTGKAAADKKGTRSV